VNRLFSSSEVEDTLSLLHFNQPAGGQGDFSLAKEAENIFSVVFPDCVKTGEAEFSLAEVICRVKEALSAKGRLLRPAA